MRQALSFLLLGVVTGVGLAALLGRSPQSGEADSTVSGRLDGGGAQALEARLTQLEAALRDEARARAALETEIATLEQQIGGLGETTAEADVATAPTLDTAADAIDVGRTPLRESARVSRRERASPEYRRNELVEAGFSTDQAQWIVDREAQTRLDMLNAQYEARRAGEAFNPFDTQRAAQTQMREQLGDAMYEQYLAATGQPTSVNVREVLDHSPGQAAGLRSGDEIVAYGGQRVFNLFELNELTLGGEPGETVVVDIRRDGQPMQIYVPRGPIGFSGGRRNFVFGPTGLGP